MLHAYMMLLQASRDPGWCAADRLTSMSKLALLVPPVQPPRPTKVAVCIHRGKASYHSEMKKGGPHYAMDCLIAHS